MGPTWATLPRLHVVVSIDGLQPEHDVRRAPANLRPYSKKHRWAEDHDSFHGHGSNDETTRILSRIPSILDAPSRDQEGMVQSVHPSGWRSNAGNPRSRGAGACHYGNDGIAKAISETGHADGGNSAVRLPATKPQRLCIRAHDPDVIGGPGDKNNTMPVWRKS